MKKRRNEEEKKMGNRNYELHITKKTTDYTDY